MSNSHIFIFRARRAVPFISQENQSVNSSSDTQRVQEVRQILHGLSQTKQISLKTGLNCACKRNPFLFVCLPEYHILLFFFLIHLIFQTVNEKQNTFDPFYSCEANNYRQLQIISIFYLLQSKSYFFKNYITLS